MRGAEIAEALGFAQFAGGDLQGAQRQRRVLRDAAGALAHASVEFRRGADFVHQADAPGFVRVDAACGQEQVERAAPADGAGQCIDAGRFVADAEACCGNPEDGVGGGETKICGERHHHPASDAGTADRGEQGLLELHERAQRAARHIAVARDGAGLGALVRELGDVGAGHEGVAFAAQDDGADLRVGVQRRDGTRKLLPHLHGDGVPAFGLIEDDPADGAFLLVTYASAHVCIVPAMAQEHEGNGPLAGTFVLDVTHVMAGSYCGLLLSMMGAEVVKVERAGGGDDLRRHQTLSGGAFRPHDAVNHGKRSLAVDLRDPRGADVLRRLAGGADVFVENYRPGTLARLGVGPDALRQRNPRLVTCSITGFGASGPEADQPGFDLVAQGAAGIMSLTGEPGRPPVVAGVPLSDLNAGGFAAMGIVSALLERERTGRGQHVDTSLFEAALAYTVWESAAWFDLGQVPGPAGSSHRLGSPYAAFATADGHLTLGAATQSNWERLCRALGRPELAADARFADGQARLRNKPELFAALEAIFATDTTDAWVARLRAEGVPSGPVRNVADAHASPQAHAREMSVSLGEHDGRERRVIGTPVKLSRTPWRVSGRVAAYGEDGDAVLRGAGFSDAEITALHGAGVLCGGASRPRDPG